MAKRPDSDPSTVVPLQLERTAVVRRHAIVALQAARLPDKSRIAG